MLLFIDNIIIEIPIKTAFQYLGKLLHLKYLAIFFSCKKLINKIVKPQEQFTAESPLSNDKI